MARQPFPPNTRSSQERPKVEPITQAIQRPPSLREKFSNEFIREDAKTVGEYVLWDIIVPAFKNLLSEATSRGLDHLLFGSAGRSTTAPPRSTVLYSSVAPAKTMFTSRPSTPTGPDVSNIIVPTFSEAEQVIAQLLNTINDYGSVVIGELYTIVGITPSPIHEKWGWRDLTSARTERVSNGYRLVLPRPVFVGKD